MPFILKIKETEQYRLFGSLPILCRSIGFDEKQEKGLSYVFSQKKENQFEDDKFLILKRELKRGGSPKQPFFIHAVMLSLRIKNDKL